MNPDFLLNNFDRIGDAPDAIPRLRRFIWDLAVRGKLVGQDPKDEPASVLLRHVKNGDRNVTGKLSEARIAIEIPVESLPFKVPPQWTWARLIEIADVSYGFAFASSRFNSNRLGMPLIRIRDISGTDTEAYYEGNFDQSFVVRKGDYLVGMDGDFNVRKWKGSSALLNQRVMRIKNWRARLAGDFFAIPLQIILDHLHISTSQTTVKHLSARQVNGIFLPLPPLAEQYRIVAKVEELMALCDRLAVQKAERENSRERLAAASHYTSMAL
jgi:type I restriction enzyme S subunit